MVMFRAAFNTGHLEIALRARLFAVLWTGPVMIDGILAARSRSWSAGSTDPPARSRRHSQQESPVPAGCRK
jgi:hypothetical protein